MTIYEINQQAYAKLPTMDDIKLYNAEVDLANFIKEVKSQYYMMLDPHGNYYTLYLYKDKAINAKAMAHEVIDIAKTLGEIKSIEVRDDMVEFWILHQDECNMFAFFDYTKGVIEVG